MVDRLRPSSADIWFHCAANPSLTAKWNNGGKSPRASARPSDEAEEGSCAAWLADTVLTQGGSCADHIGKECPDNGWPVDPSMASLIQDYVDHVKQQGGQYKSELQVHLTHVVAGTLDSMSITNDGRKLIVDDLKYGYGVVTPWSKQPLIYAGAVYYSLLPGERDRITEIQIGIYQPRAFHPDGVYRSRTLTPIELHSEITELVERSERCIEPDPVATPGRHCKYCKVNHVCGALGNELYETYTMMTNAVSKDMTDREMAVRLQWLENLHEMVKGLRSSLHAEGMARVEAGQQLPGWVVKSGLGQRRYNTSADVVRMITGVDPLANQMCSPIQLEARGASKEDVAKVTERPSTKRKLVPMSKKEIREMFK